MRTNLLAFAIATSAFAAGCYHDPCGACTSSPAITTVPQMVSAPPRPSPSPRVADGPRQDGFDSKVRADFFDGFRGNSAALDRVVKVCEDTLAGQPNHTEAMVWHGAALIGRAGLAFRSGDATTGLAAFSKGLVEMDRAVELDPKNLGVRIPRGAVVLVAAPLVPEPNKTQLIQRGVADFEIGLAGQTPYFGKLSLHAREQLLYGLTDGYAALGDAAKAEAIFRRMTVDAAGSSLLARAKARAAGEAVAGPTPCQECHGR
jgi:hypothetical protein